MQRGGARLSQGAREGQRRPRRAGGESASLEGGGCPGQVWGSRRRECVCRGLSKLPGRLPAHPRGAKQGGCCWPGRPLSRTTRGPGLNAPPTAQETQGTGSIYRGLRVRLPAPWDGLWGRGAVWGGGRCLRLDTLKAGESDRSVRRSPSALDSGLSEWLAGNWAGAATGECAGRGDGVWPRRCRGGALECG